MRFSTSKDFLTYLQRIWTIKVEQEFDEEQAKWSSDFFEISKNRFKEFETDPIIVTPGENRYDELINRYVDEISPGLSALQKEQLGNKIAIGSVDTIHINAVCTTDKKGNYAVVVNSSLFTYLHKYGKLLTALSKPSSVVYCNRKPPERLTTQDIVDYIDELPQIYFAMKKVMGPMIHLDKKYFSVHMLLLEIAEKFIIGHELGHFYKGHLDNKANTELFLNEFQRLRNDNHQLEFEADDFAADLLIRDLSKPNISEIKKELVSGGISLLFTALNSLNPYSSETHPAPIDRMNRLISKLHE